MVLAGTSGDRLLTQLQETGEMDTGFSLYYLNALIGELGIDPRTVKVTGKIKASVPRPDLLAGRTSL